MESVRIDKWLWAVRFYKTRSLASNACKSGKISINDISVKPSREVKTGDIIQIKIPPIKKTIKITDLIENRISAKLIINFMEDITPPEEYQKLKIQKDTFLIKRENGRRPTKKDRRDINHFFPEW